MQKYAVFGNPIAHSLSPLLHNAAFGALKINAYYDKILLQTGVCISDEFRAQNLSGANITVPFKECAYREADVIDEMVQEIRAVNTYVLKAGKIHAYNTDAMGFFLSASSKLNFKNALVIGAGGTAKAIATVLRREKKDVFIVNRSREKLVFFTEGGFRADLGERLDYFDFDLVINTTSAGLKDELLPLPSDKLESLAARKPFFFDVIYGKQTPFLRFAQHAGLPFCDGLDMLLWQGALAFCHFQEAQDVQQIHSIMERAILAKGATL
ncbi:MAG: shikimate dehydrogenase [Helicobacteraceae bacterium]